MKGGGNIMKSLKKPQKKGRFAIVMLYDGNECIIINNDTCPKNNKSCQ